MEVLFRNRSDRIDLCRAPDSKGCESSEQRKYNAKPLHIQASFKGIHGAALHTAVLCLHSVLYSDQRFRIFCRDSEYTGQPAPQNSTRSAERNGCAHADDISGSDRRRQCSCQSAKGGNLTFCIRIFRNRKLDPFADGFSLDETGTDRHEYMRSEKQNYHPPSPDKAIH